MVGMLDLVQWGASMAVSSASETSGFLMRDKLCFQGLHSRVLLRFKKALPQSLEASFVPVPLLRMTSVTNLSSEGHQPIQ